MMIDEDVFVVVQFNTNFYLVPPLDSWDIFHRWREPQAGITFKNVSSFSIQCSTKMKIIFGKNGMNEIRRRRVALHTEVIINNRHNLVIT